MRQVSKKSLNLGGKILPLDPPVVMGILNITPDSFYAESRAGVLSTEELIKRAKKMSDEGAAILDIGGYSTRPGADEVTTEAELNRVIPAIRSIRNALPGVFISVDTFRSQVAEEAVRNGAQIINDVSGGSLDNEMFHVAARLKVPYILMHMRGTPATMQRMTTYDRFPEDVIRELQTKVLRLRELGVADIIVDPGFGFAKTVEQNFNLLRTLDAFHQLDCPLMLGVSRKSTISKTLQVDTSETLNGTTVLHTVALMAGTHILRAHDAKEAREAIVLTEKIKKQF